MPLPFEAAPDRARGEDFVDYLYERCRGLTETQTQARTLSRRLWAFLQEWDRLRHELRDRGERREPTVEEYAARWRMPSRTANQAFAEFVGVFPTERDPGRISKELWKGIRLQGDPGRYGGLMALGSVKVLES
jgi:hypothetical protein